jgi:putative transposase
MGRTRYRFGEAPFPHFPTCTVVGWLPVFTRTETLQIVLDSWQFLQDQDRLVLFGYVVLENHIYFIGCRHNRLMIQRSEKTRSVENGIPTRERGNESAPGVPSTFD